MKVELAVSLFVARAKEQFREANIDDSLKVFETRVVGMWNSVRSSQ